MLHRADDWGCGDPGVIVPADPQFHPRCTVLCSRCTGLWSQTPGYHGIHEPCPRVEAPAVRCLERRSDRSVRAARRSRRTRAGRWVWSSRGAGPDLCRTIATRRGPARRYAQRPRGERGRVRGAAPGDSGGGACRGHARAFGVGGAQGCCATWGGPRGRWRRQDRWRDFPDGWRHRGPGGTATRRWVVRHGWRRVRRHQWIVRWTAFELRAAAESVAAAPAASAADAGDTAVKVVTSVTQQVPGPAGAVATQAVQAAGRAVPAVPGLGVP